MNIYLSELTYCTSYLSKQKSSTGMNLARCNGTRGRELSFCWGKGEDGGHSQQWQLSWVMNRRSLKRPEEERAPGWRVQQV